MRTEARTTAITDSQVSPGSGDITALPRECSPPRNLLPRYCVFALLSAGALFWDLWSKWSVFKWLNCPGQHPMWKGSILGIPVDFELATTFNLGALWGMGQGQTWLFASLSIVAVGVIVYFLWTSQAVESWWLTVSSGLLLAGTLGNLYDRLGLHGWKNADGPVYGVRDFLDFVFFNGGFHWATFNFADSYLVVGAIMLALQSFSTTASEPAVKACPSTCP